MKKNEALFSVYYDFENDLASQVEGAKQYIKAEETMDLENCEELEKKPSKIKKRKISIFKSIHEAQSLPKQEMV